MWMLTFWRRDERSPFSFLVCNLISFDCPGHVGRRLKISRLSKKDQQLTDFSRLGLAAPLLHALTKQGYSRPTPIQAQAIPPIMAGRDLIRIAPTRPGKDCGLRPANPALSCTAQTRRSAQWLPRAGFEPDARIGEPDRRELPLPWCGPSFVDRGHLRRCAAWRADQCARARPRHSGRDARPPRGSPRRPRGAPWC